MMNERERQDFAELRKYYQDTQCRIRRIKRFRHFLRERMDEVKDRPGDLANAASMYAGVQMCLEAMGGYAFDFPGIPGECADQEPACSAAEYEALHRCMEILIPDKED